jgi:hypothetical protein
MESELGNEAIQKMTESAKILCVFNATIEEFDKHCRIFLEGLFQF